jgi:hypothetical protein
LVLLEHVVTRSVVAGAGTATTKLRSAEGLPAKDPSPRAVEPLSVLPQGKTWYLHAASVGSVVGTWVGFTLGSGDGAWVGKVVGMPVGCGVGWSEGCSVGTRVG